MELKVTFLGTGDYHPSQQRNSKSLHIHRGGDNFLFEVGEGTVRQMMKFNLTLNVSSIFLTGTRYDHTGGLIGLLDMYDSTSINREEKVEIFTPNGTENKIRDLVYSFDDYNFEVNINEVTPGVVLKEEDYSIEAFETESLETSIGYILSENSRKGRFNRDKAEELGVPVGPKFSELTDGNPVTLETGETIYPEQVLGNPRPGRKIVYTGDTRPIDSTINVASHADLLIHDSAFAENWNERAVETGHSTALEAATIADEASVDRLALTNISPKFTGLDFRLRQEAESVFEGNLTVAEDGLTINVSYKDSGEKDEVNHESRSADSYYSVGKRSENLKEQIKTLRDLVKTGYVDLPEYNANNLSEVLDKVIENIDNNVLVLGSYDGRHSSELAEVKSALEENGYNANLATDLPSHKGQSLEQTIAMYMMVSRFCLMIDREPSGHLNEYEIAKQQRNILARLVPEDGGSTYMMGGEEGVLLRNIKSFKFKYDPSEVIEEAISWAETLSEESKEAYSEGYPWRQDD